VPEQDAATACARIVDELQAEDRVPAVTAAVARADRPLWTHQVGTAGNDTPLGADTQFRIGSVTKTFTAALVLQLRDQGLLGLDDPLSVHLDVPAHGDLTIRGMLSHTAGLQREPAGNIWDTLVIPDTASVIDDLVRAEAVLAPSRRWHYSNLAYALLGHLVGTKVGGTWEEALVDRLLAPLGLIGTTVAPRPPYAQGYLVEAYTDHARPEPEFPMGGVAPAAQLWSTAADMAKWALFLAHPDPAVLAPATVDEMCQPLTVTDPDQWTAGWGLGLILQPQGGRVMHAGHDGAMPGFLAGVYCRRGQKIGAAAMGSSTTAGTVCLLPHKLIAASLEHDPRAVEPWTPGEPVPEAYASVLGRWWSEGSEFVFCWRKGHLEARAAAAPAERPPAVFAVEGADVLRGVSGRETGEKLELTRDAAGTVTQMRWATYRVTRDQQTFDPADR
jgi:CubicO group peptidase (beta-lactamase class C family)